MDLLDVDVAEFDGLVVGHVAGDSGGSGACVVFGVGGCWGGRKGGVRIGLGRVLGRMY